MSSFTEQEQSYLNEQLLGRLATANDGGQPHVTPVGFRYNPDTETIEIGGLDLTQTKKFQDIRANSWVAFVVDDLATTDPWRPRGITIRGEADTFDRGGKKIMSGFGDAWIRITPRRIVSWGLDSDGFKAHSRTIR